MIKFLFRPGFLLIAYNKGDIPKKSASCLWFYCNRKYRFRRHRLWTDEINDWFPDMIQVPIKVEPEILKIIRPFLGQSNVDEIILDNIKIKQLDLLINIIKSSNV